MSVLNTGWSYLIPTGPTAEEKRAYYEKNLQLAKYGAYTGREIKPGTELLDGWDPWGGTGKSTGIEIVAALARAWDQNDGDHNSIIPGDWFDIDIGGTVYRYVCQGRDLYYIDGDKTNGSHHYTFAPDSLASDSRVYAIGGPVWASSSLRIWMNNTFYNSLPQMARDSIIELGIPYIDSINNAQRDQCRVFPPSYIEAFGSTYPTDPVSETLSDFTPWTILSYSAETRNRALTAYWTRGVSSSLSYVWIVSEMGGSQQYAYQASSGVLPCFNVG